MDWKHSIVRLLETLAAWLLSSRMLRRFALVFYCLHKSVHVQQEGFLLMVPFCSVHFHPPQLGSVHFHPSLAPFCSVRTSTFHFQQQDNTKHTTVCLMSVHVLQQVFHHRSNSTVFCCTLHSLKYCLYIVGFQTSTL